jgi:hypothetical protein
MAGLGFWERELRSHEPVRVRYIYAWDRDIKTGAMTPYYATRAIERRELPLAARIGQEIVADADERPKITSVNWFGHPMKFHQYADRLIIEFPDGGTYLCKTRIK